MGYIRDDVEMASDVPLEVSDCLYDPQTSGGLLIAVPEDKAEKLCRRLKDGGDEGQIIGYVKKFDGKSIRVSL